MRGAEKGVKSPTGKIETEPFEIDQLTSVEVRGLNGTNLELSPGGEGQGGARPKETAPKRGLQTAVHVT